MTKQTKVQFVVSFDLPDRALLSQCRDYIQDAVMTWRGQCEPRDPMWQLNPDTVRVRRLSHKT